MSRRFSDEPINLIRRIPTPEQLDAARPVKQSFSEKFAETAASFLRSVMRSSPQAESPKQTESDDELDIRKQDELERPQTDHLASESGPSDWESGAPETGRPGLEETAAGQPKKWEPSPSPVVVSSVQPEEVAELRAYLLRQQQDIARLVGQVQELRSLVMTQQHILERLGKGLESGSGSLLTAGVAASGAKRNKPARQKPVMKDKVVAPEDDLIRLPLNV